MTALAPSGIRSDVVAMLTAGLDAVDRGPAPLAERLACLDFVTADLEDPAATARELAYLAAAFLSVAAPAQGRTPAELIQSLAAGQESGTPESEPSSSSASAAARSGVPPTSTDRRRFPGGARPDA